jgi:hypothetical protein
MEADVALALGFGRMRLICLLTQCQHFPGFVYQKARLCPDSLSIEIDVRPRRGSKPVCSGCHQRGTAYDLLNLRRFEFIPIWGFAVLLLYHMRRVDCRTCGVRVEELPWAIGKHQLTKTYMVFLAHWARKLSWKETAVSFCTSWDKVCQALEYVVAWGPEHRSFGPIRAIGVDEIQYAKGHKYLTLVYQIEQDFIRLLWIGKDRTVESFEQFFTLIGKPLAEGIEFVCSDMWKPYLRVIRERCTNAVNILDRFHIVAKMNDALDDVRAAEARRLAQDGFPASPQANPMVRAQAQGQSHPHATLPAPRSLALQPQDGAGVSAQGRLSAVLGLRLTSPGRQVSRRLVPTGHALPHRADEEDCQDPSRPPRAHPQLFPCQEAVLQRGGRGPQQQGQTHHAKILRFPHLSRHRNCFISRSW